MSKKIDNNIFDDEKGCRPKSTLLGHRKPKKLTPPNKRNSWTISGPRPGARTVRPWRNLCTTSDCVVSIAVTASRHCVFLKASWKKQRWLLLRERPSLSVFCSCFRSCLQQQEKKNSLRSCC